MIAWLLLSLLLRSPSSARVLGNGALCAQRTVAAGRRCGTGPTDSTMDFLKSITTSVLNSTGVSFPFTIGDKVPDFEGKTIWDVREGIKKDDQTLLTLFIFDVTLPALQPGNRDRRPLLQLAKNALKKLRTIRHPDVIKYIDSVETETHVYIATERLRPLESVVREWDVGGGLATASKGGKEQWIGWGVQRIATALAFLNSPPLSLHHSLLLPTSIFVTPALEWRLGGFELLTARDDAQGVLWGMGGLLPGNVAQRCAPEVQKGGWGVLRDTDPALSDTYIFALLIYSLYNPNSALPSLTTAPQPSSIGAMPKSLFPLYKRMLNPNPRTRLPTPSFVPEATATGFWAANPLVVLVDGLDGFELRSDNEKLALLRTIKDSSTSLPAPFLSHRVLPSLLHSLSLPTAPSSTLLPLVLSLGKLVDPKEYAKVVLEPVVKLYASPDRGTRMALLDGLGEYVDRMDPRMVQDKVWPHLITGFADTVAVIREATVKAIYPLAPKLSDRIMNNDLLRLLAKMQTDPEPSIRTNTCILLGRLAPNLGPNTKKKVLVPAFARSLKDPFVHARVAGLMALMATVECFDRDDLAGKVVPNMSFTLVDREKLVRDQAFKAMAMFMKRLEEMAATMPETMIRDQSVEASQSYGPTTTTSQANGLAGQAGLVNSATGAAGALAGWAIASLGKQLQSSEVHSSMSAQPSGLGTAASASRPSNESASSFGTAGPSQTAYKPSIAAQTRTPSRSARPQTTGMRLGGTKAASSPAGGSTLVDALAGEFEEDGDEVAKAWGTDDLMDVNADEDDWSAFETAPVPEVVVPPPQSYYVNPPKVNGGKPVSVVAAPRTSVSSDHDGWDEPTIPVSKPSREPSPATTLVADKPATPSAVNLASLSKEEKDKEMARRREERKARIAAMKEQKKKPS